MHANAPFVNLYTSSNSGSTQILILVTQASPKHSFAYDISYCIRCRIWWVIFSHQLSNCRVALCNLYLSCEVWKQQPGLNIDLGHEVVRLFSSGNGAEASRGKKKCTNKLQVIQNHPKSLAAEWGDHTNIHHAFWKACQGWWSDQTLFKTEDGQVISKLD